MPRVIASIATLFPIESWAFLILFFTSLIAAIVGMVVFYATESLGLTTRTRILISLITVLAPSVANEVLGNLANLHTLFLWSAPWVFLVQPKNFKQSILWALYLFFATTTEIQIIYFAPLLLWKFKNPKRLPLVLATALGLSMQSYVALFSDRASYFDLPTASHLVDGFLLQAVLTGWIGVMYLTRAIMKDFGIWVAYIAFTPALVATFLIMARSKVKQFNFYIAYLWLASIIIWVFGFAINNINIAEETLAYKFQMRHATVPSMLMIAIVIIYLDRRFRSQRELEIVIRRATAFMLILITVGTFAIGALGTRSQKNSWSLEVGKAKNSCEMQANITSVNIPIAPTKPEGWAISVPCAVVRN